MRNFRNLSILLLLVASFASATVVQTFTSRASWEGATTGRTDVDFESLSLPLGYASYGTLTGLTTGGLTFVGVVDASSYYLYALNPAIGDAQDFGSGTELRGPYLPCTVVGACASPHTSYLSVTLPSGATSFGLDLMTAYPQAQSFTIQLDSIDVGLVITTQARPTRTFFGVTTDAPISQVRITLNSGVINQTQGLFDNFAYGAAGTSGGGGTTDPSGDTPEVATMLCVGSGLMAMRLLRRRQTPALATA